MVNIRCLSKINKRDNYLFQFPLDLVHLGLHLLSDFLHGHTALLDPLVILVLHLNKALGVTLEVEDGTGVLLHLLHNETAGTQLNYGAAVSLENRASEMKLDHHSRLKVVSLLSPLDCLCNQEGGVDQHTDGDKNITTNLQKSHALDGFGSQTSTFRNKVESDATPAGEFHGGFNRTYKT
jgi:hypothetical protein